MPRVSKRGKSIYNNGQHQEAAVMTSPFPDPLQAMKPEETPVVILAEGVFSEYHSKLAMGVIRYGKWPVKAVIDSRRAGKKVSDITSLSSDAPIVASLDEALALGVKALMIGTAPAGGKLPPEWRAVLTRALENGLHLINGLHFFLTEDQELVRLAQAHNAILWDVRDPEAYGKERFQELNWLKPRPGNLRTITMVGTDCSTGKMHTGLELFAASKKAGQSCGFVATGQIGILIAGRGVPLDRVIGDFMAGALEVCIQDEIEIVQQENPHADSHWLFVEGQGSLGHPAYSGVTLSLVHGSNPDMMVLCHKAGLETVGNYPQLKLPPLTEIITRYETAAGWIRPGAPHSAKVIAISVNTSALDEAEARAYLDQLAIETGLPVTDPVRWGVENVLAAIRAEEGRLAAAL